MSLSIDKVRAQDRNAAIACRQGLGALDRQSLASRSRWRCRRRPTKSAGTAATSRWRRRRARSPRAPLSSRCRAMCWRRGTSNSRPTFPSASSMPRPRLSLGSYDHIALQLPGNPLGLGRDDIVIEQSNSTRTALLFANMGSSSLCSIDVAGSFGRDLAAEGEPAMVAFAVEWLSKLFGSDIGFGGQEIERDPLECRAFRAGRDVSRRTRQPAIAKSSHRADRLHVPCGRGDPRNPVGNG